MPADEQADVVESVRHESNETPDAERAFDRAFTDAVVQRALGRLRRQYEEEGEPALFWKGELAVLGGRQKTDDAAVSKLTGMSTPLLKKKRHDAKKDWIMRYKGCLREELAALGVRRSSIQGVIAELVDAAP